jgi:hypothetical protein
MNRSPKRRGPLPLTMPLLAGWLFADLFVVLFIVGLATSTPPALPKPRPSATPAASPSASSPATASPVPSTHRTTQALGLNQRPYVVCLGAQTAQGGDAAMDAALDAQLPAPEARAGFVLVYAPIADGGLQAATDDANAMVSYLLQHDRVFSRASGEGGGHGNAAWEFQIFFFTSSSGPSGGQTCG